jgi:hypothetical protein
MAIRLRVVDGVLVALCAARSVAKEGDVYLDDGMHYALAQKFARDWDGERVRAYGDDHPGIVEAEESNNPNRADWDKTFGREDQGPARVCGVFKAQTGLPDDLGPLNLKAWLYNNLGFCGCTDMGDAIGALLKLLEWHDDDMTAREPWGTLYRDGEGLFYLLAGFIDVMGLSEHGSGIRHPWLTASGKRLLAALKAHTPEQIESAYGEAYDGCTYGEPY